MKITLRVVLLSVAVSVLTGLLVVTALLIDPTQLGMPNLLGALEVAIFVSPFFSVPLGLAGAIVAVAILHRKNSLPRNRWAGRGSIVGAGLGGVGPGILLLLIGDARVAGLYALLGSVAGAVAGGVTGALLSHCLNTDIPRAKPS